MAGRDARTRMRNAANGAHNNKRLAEIRRNKQARNTASASFAAAKETVEDNNTPVNKQPGKSSSSETPDEHPTQEARWCTPTYTQSKLNFSQTSEGDKREKSTNESSKTQTNRYEALQNDSNDKNDATDTPTPKHAEIETHKVIKRLMDQQDEIPITLSDFRNLTEHEAIEVLLHQILKKVTSTETTKINKERMVREWRFKTKLQLLKMANEKEARQKAVKMIQYGTDQGTSEMEIRIYNLKYLLGTLPEAALEENTAQLGNIKLCIEKYATRAYGDYMHDIQPILDRETNMDTLISILTEPGALPKYLTGKGLDISFGPPSLIILPEMTVKQELKEDINSDDQQTILSEPAKTVHIEYKTIKRIKTEEGKKAELGKMLRQYLPKATPNNWQAIFHHIMGLKAERISQLVFFPGEMEDFITQNYPNNMAQDNGTSGNNTEANTQTAIPLTSTTHAKNQDTLQSASWATRAKATTTSTGMTSTMKQMNGIQTAAHNHTALRNNITPTPPKKTSTTAPLGSGPEPLRRWGQKLNATDTEKVYTTEIKMEASDTGIRPNALQALTMYMANIFPTVKRLFHTIRLSPWDESAQTRELNDKNDLKDEDEFLKKYIKNPRYDNRGSIIFQVKLISSFDFNRLRSQGDQQPGLKEQRDQHFAFLRQSKIWISIQGTPKIYEYQPLYVIMHCSDADNEDDIRHELIDRVYDRTGIIMHQDSIRVQHRPLIVPITIRDKTKKYQSITTKILAAKTTEINEIFRMISNMEKSPHLREQYPTTYDYEFADIYLHANITEEEYYNKLQSGSEFYKFRVQVHLKGIPDSIDLHKVIPTGNGYDGHPNTKTIRQLLMGTSTLYENADGIPMPPPYSKVQRGRDSIWILQGWMRDIEHIKYHGYNILYNQLKGWLPDGVGDTIEILIRAKRTTDDPQYWARNSNFQGIPEEPTPLQKDYGGTTPHEWPMLPIDNGNTHPPKDQHNQAQPPTNTTSPTTDNSNDHNKSTVTRAERVQIKILAKLTAIEDKLANLQHQLDDHEELFFQYVNDCTEYNSGDDASSCSSKDYDEEQDDDSANNYNKHNINQDDRANIPNTNHETNNATNNNKTNIRNKKENDNTNDNINYSTNNNTNNTAHKDTSNDIYNNTNQRTSTTEPGHNDDASNSSNSECSSTSSAASTQISTTENIAENESKRQTSNTTHNALPPIITTHTQEAETTGPHDQEMTNTTSLQTNEASASSDSTWTTDDDITDTTIPTHRRLLPEDIIDECSNSNESTTTPTTQNDIDNTTSMNHTHTNDHELSTDDNWTADSDTTDKTMKAHRLLLPEDILEEEDRNTSGNYSIQVDTKHARMQEYMDTMDNSNTPNATRMKAIINEVEKETQDIRRGLGHTITHSGDKTKSNTNPRSPANPNGVPWADVSSGSDSDPPLSRDKTKTPIATHTNDTYSASLPRILTRQDLNDLSTGTAVQIGDGTTKQIGIIQGHESSRDFTNDETLYNVQIQADNTYVMRLPHRRFTTIFGKLNTGEMITRNTVTTADTTITNRRSDLYQAGKYPDDIINDETGEDEWDKLDDIEADPYRHDYTTNIPRHITQMDWTHIGIDTIVYFQEKHDDTWNAGIIVGRRHANMKQYDIECNQRKSIHYNVPSTRIDIACGTLTSPMGALITKDWMKSAFTTVTKPSLSREETRLRRYRSGLPPEEIIRADAEEENERTRIEMEPPPSNIKSDGEDGYDTSTEGREKRITTPNTNKTRRRSGRLAKLNKT